MGLADWWEKICRKAGVPSGVRSRGSSSLLSPRIEPSISGCSYAAYMDTHADSRKRQDGKKKKKSVKSNVGCLKEEEGREGSSRKSLDGSFTYSDNAAWRVRFFSLSKFISLAFFSCAPRPSLFCPSEPFIKFFKLHPVVVSSLWDSLAVFLFHHSLHRHALPGCFPRPLGLCVGCEILRRFECLEGSEVSTFCPFVAFMNA